MHIVTAHVAVDADILWTRIQARLAAEPERERYKEGDKKWMEHVVRFYESRDWSLRVTNNEPDAIDAVRDRLVSML